MCHISREQSDQVLLTVWEKKITVFRSQSHEMCANSKPVLVAHWLAIAPASLVIIHSNPYSGRNLKKKRLPEKVLGSKGSCWYWAHHSWSANWSMKITGYHHIPHTPEGLEKGLVLYLTILAVWLNQSQSGAIGVIHNWCHALGGGGPHICDDGWRVCLKKLCYIKKYIYKNVTATFAQHDVGEGRSDFLWRGRRA